jgi:hypothetical protein
MISGATAHSADGRVFTLDITEKSAIVHEQPDR